MQMRREKVLCPKTVNYIFEFAELFLWSDGAGGLSCVLLCTTNNTNIFPGSITSIIRMGP